MEFLNDISEFPAVPKTGATNQMANLESNRDKLARLGQLHKLCCCLFIFCLFVFANLLHN